MGQGAFVWGWVIVISFEEALPWERLILSILRGPWSAGDRGLCTLPGLCRKPYDPSSMRPSVRTCFLPGLVLLASSIQLRTSNSDRVLLFQEVPQGGAFI